MRPEPHFDTALGAFRLPPDVPAPEAANDPVEHEQAGGIARDLVGTVLLLGITVAAIVAGIVVAFFAGKGA